MTERTDLDTLGSLWQADESPPQAAWESRLRRWRWQMVLAWTAEGIITLVLIVGTVMAAGDGWTLREALLWGNGWLLWVVTAGFAVWNRRGLWRVYAESPEDFLEHEALRARRGLRTVAFVRIVIAVQVVLLASLILALDASSWAAWTTLAIVALAYLGWAAVFSARARRDLHAIDLMRTALAENGNDSANCHL